LFQASPTSFLGLHPRRVCCCAGRRHRSTAAAAGRPAAAAPQHGAQQQIALGSKCDEQCHVDSRRRMLNADFLSTVSQSRTTTRRGASFWSSASTLPAPPSSSSSGCRLKASTRATNPSRVRPTLGPDLQNILRQSCDRLTIMLKLRSTYDGRLIYQTSYEERRAFLRYDLLAKS